MTQVCAIRGLCGLGLFRSGALVLSIGVAITFSQSATSEVQRASVDDMGNQLSLGSWYPSISADGLFIAFDSWDNNIASTDTNDDHDVFVYDRIVGTTTHVSVDSSSIGGNDWSGNSSMSGDGRYVAFDSMATNLVPNDTGPHPVNPEWQS